MSIHYPYLLDPTRYPDYSRRPVRVPTWATFDHKTQFMTLRVFSQQGKRLVNFEEELDLYCKLNLGRIIWPVFHTMFAENFKDLVASVKRRGLYLFDFWGHVPGADTGQMWGHCTPPPGMVNYLEKELGDHFLGIDNGEQDGRYIGLYAPQQCPCFQDRFQQYLNFHRHFERMGNDLGNHLTVLVSLCYGHYFLKEGNHILIGAETAQLLPNSQVYYAFIRGACKQYGVLWFGNSSIFNRWSFKSYESTGVLNGYYKFGPDQGTSLSLLKRLLYSHYLYNSVAIGFENSWIAGDNVEKRLKGLPVPMETDASTRVLSPVGDIQAGAAAFVEKQGQPGVMHTPVALLLDFFAGWAMPRQPYAGDRDYAYQVWGGMPYDAGDHLTDVLLSLLYPGYEDSGYFRDERGFMTSTPYGDIADCLLSDVSSWVLRQYGLVVVAGTLTPGAEVRDNVRVFVEAGGDVVLTAANAFLVPDLILRGQPEPIPAGTVVHWGNGDRDVESDAFELFPATLPTDAEVLARCRRRPAVVRLPLGKGSYTILLSPRGLNAEPLVKGKLVIAEDKPLARPFRMLKHVWRTLDTALKAQCLFSVPPELGLITCRKKEGEYLLGLFNNNLHTRPWGIESCCGAIQSIIELPVDQAEKGKMGYWPTGRNDNDGGTSDDQTIAGGDVRLFSVRVCEKGVRCLTPAEPPVRPVGRLLGIRSAGTIQEAILQRPTFFQHFDGVKVDWTYLRQRDAGQLERERDWLIRQQVRVIVDFSRGLNFYPDLTLVDSFAPRYQESMADLTEVFAKMQKMDAHEAVISLHQKPDDHSCDERRTSERMLTGVREVCQHAAEHGITLHLQAHEHKWHGSMEKMIGFIVEADCPNLRYALNTGHIMMLGENVKQSLLKAGKFLGLILLCAPRRDLFDQWVDAHAPVSGSGLNPISLRAYAHISQILDADYRGLDEEYRDCRSVWGK